MAKKKSPEPSYESAMENLQLIISQLQEDELKLDELSAKIKEANELTQFCRSKLRSTEEELNGLFDASKP